MGAACYWLIIVGMGAITYAMRLSFILLPGHLRLPAILRRSLRFVPPAVFSALILPAVLRPAGPLEISQSNFRLLAAAVAAIVAWRTKNTVLTIAAGMAALWILQWALR